MWKLIDIVRSSKEGKKWMATFEDNTTGRRKRTHFGDSSMEDYTQHKDPERAENYRSRHAKDLKTNDPTRAGYLSYYVLWDGPNRSENIRRYKKRFNL